LHHRHTEALLKISDADAQLESLGQQAQHRAVDDVDLSPQLL
jgi:hypothetical protein